MMSLVSRVRTFVGFPTQTPGRPSRPPTVTHDEERIGGIAERTLLTGSDSTESSHPMIFDVAELTAKFLSIKDLFSLVRACKGHDLVWKEAALYILGKVRLFPEAPPLPVEEGAYFTRAELRKIQTITGWDGFPLDNLAVVLSLESASLQQLLAYFNKIEHDPILVELYEFCQSYQPKDEAEARSVKKIIQFASREVVPLWHSFKIAIDTHPDGQDYSEEGVTIGASKTFHLSDSQFVCRCGGGRLAGIGASTDMDGKRSNYETIQALSSLTFAKFVRTCRFVERLNTREKVREKQKQLGVKLDVKLRVFASTTLPVCQLDSIELVLLKQRLKRPGSFSGISEKEMGAIRERSQALGEKIKRGLLINSEEAKLVAQDIRKLGEAFQSDNEVQKLAYKAMAQNVAEQTHYLGNHSVKDLPLDHVFRNAYEAHGHFYRACAEYKKIYLMMKGFLKSITCSDIVTFNNHLSIALTALNSEMTTSRDLFQAIGDLLGYMEEKRPGQSNDFKVLLQWMLDHLDNPAIDPSIKQNKKEELVQIIKFIVDRCKDVDLLRISTTIFNEYLDSKKHLDNLFKTLGKRDGKKPAEVALRLQLSEDKKKFVNILSRFIDFTKRTNLLSSQDQKRDKFKDKESEVKSPITLEQLDDLQVRLVDFPVLDTYFKDHLDRLRRIANLILAPTIENQRLLQDARLTPVEEKDFIEFAEKILAFTGKKWDFLESLELQMKAEAGSEAYSKKVNTTIDQLIGNLSLLDMLGEAKSQAKMKTQYIPNFVVIKNNFPGVLEDLFAARISLDNELEPALIRGMDTDRFQVCTQDGEKFISLSALLTSGIGVWTTKLVDTVGSYTPAGVPNRGVIIKTGHAISPLITNISDEPQMLLVFNIFPDPTLNVSEHSNLRFFAAGVGKPDFSVEIANVPTRGVRGASDVVTLDRVTLKKISESLEKRLIKGVCPDMSKQAQGKPLKMETDPMPFKGGVRAYMLAAGKSVTVCEPSMGFEYIPFLEKGIEVDCIVVLSFPVDSAGRPIVENMTVTPIQTTLIA